MVFEKDDNLISSSKRRILFDEVEFTEWNSLNDAIMGGSSQASCHFSPEGLNLKGNLIEEGGGFVSCRSSILKPPLDLSDYNGIEIIVDGEGRTLKIAFSCLINDNIFNNLIFRDICWVASFTTNQVGTTKCKILFSTFQPTVRAKKIFFPVKFNISAITRVQLLHSKFGQPGEINPGFRPGNINFLIRNINAIS
tara:strand:- start:181 stop:765 length:585 start_codon:yes stop_codon:yes gene_type:complete